MKNHRIVILFLGFSLLFGLVILRGAYLQIFPDERLKNLKSRQYETTVTLLSRRGAVFDRNGKELAVSVRADSLFADPSMIEQPKRVARKLAKILKLDADVLYKKIHDDEKRFVWIQRQLEPALVAQIKAQKLKGIGFVEEAKRIYPNGKLAASALGFVGSEGQGLAGIEARYDRELQGETKKVSLPRDARGRPLLLSGHVLTENSDGADLELTLDHEVQFVLEQELKNAMDKHAAAGAWGVVLDPATSEILAMAQVPGFNPQMPQSVSEEVRKNKLITDVYEPGSVLKTLLIARGIEDKVIAPNSKFDCENGRMVIGDRVIREAEAKEKYGLLSVSEILAFSSNVGSTKIAFQLGQPAVRTGLTDFGFGSKLGVDIQGESRGIMHDLPWRPHHFANISFGHGISATALQVANSYAAIANGGTLLRPYLVKSIRESNTGRTRYAQVQPIRRVISKETAEKMKMLLVSATEVGSTGVKARIPGYQVAGKTGTAQKVDANGMGYKKNAYISSFAGFVPAHDPKFVIYIAVDEPQKEYYGSSVAAPVFAKVGAFALRKAQISPVYLSEKDVLSNKPVAKVEAKAPKVVEVVSGDKQMPDLTGKHLREALRILKANGISARTVGEGVVSRSWPAATQSLPAGKPVTLFLDSSHVQ